jgi:hypothetical protein
MSKFVGPGPSHEKRIYRAAVSQRLRNTAPIVKNLRVFVKTDTWSSFHVFAPSTVPDPQSLVHENMRVAVPLLPIETLVLRAAQSSVFPINRIIFHLIKNNFNATQFNCIFMYDNNNKTHKCV